MKVSQLISILQNIQNDTGDCEILMYNQYDYHNPPSDDDCVDIEGIEVQGIKSYYGSGSKSLDLQPKVYIKY
jgi:hypothetical protein